MAEQVNPENNNSNNRNELNYNEWIDANMKNICNHKNGRISYVNRRNKSPNKVETNKIIQELSLLDLADANALSATLRPFGEKICKIGGWLKYLELKNEDELKEREEESEIKILNKEILKLQKQNLTLSNRKLKRDLIIWIIGLFIGAVITNWKDILILLKVLPPE